MIVRYTEDQPEYKTMMEAFCKYTPVCLQNVQGYIDSVNIEHALGPNWAVITTASFDIRVESRLEAPIEI